MTWRPPLLKSITLQGFLSYGPEAVTIPLTALNVLIGPNGSGKSNLVEALSILRAVPRDLPSAIRRGGGVRDWFWKEGRTGADEALLEIVLAEGQVARLAKGEEPAIRYRLVFGVEGNSFVVRDERVEHEHPEPGTSKPFLYLGYEHGRPMVRKVQQELRALLLSIDPTQSILSQRRDPEAYPELARLADLLLQILIFRSWQFGPDSAVRSSCRADVRTDSLSESLDNLPARLAVLMGTPAIKRRLVELLGELAPGFDDLAIVPEGGLLQLYLIEGNRSVPAHRLSDGTLRYLCLLTILLDPDPPPLIAIEEPELGLHPDILPILRDLMVEASTRTQLIVTTHSTQMVDAMTDHADSVLICEKTDGPSRVSRLKQEEVDRWREHGSLGALWMSGHLGGTRW